MVEQWHWYTPLTEGQFWYDTFNIAPETKAFVIGVSETVGQAAGAVVKPTAKAVTAPLIAVAVIAVGVGAFVFRDEIKGALK